MLLIRGSTLPVHCTGELMLFCTACLHVDDRDADHCPSCGESAFATVTKDGDLVTVPAEAGMPCQSCFETERELKLRLYRRVVGALIFDRIWAEAGYFCASCRRTHFAKNMSFTLVCGWWGVVAMLFRNPYAIAVNLWALFAPPFAAGNYGAINANEIRTAAEHQEERNQRLADVYMRMPGWMESLTEGDLHRVLSDVDYYAVLGADPSMSHSELRAIWRSQAKAHHPDLGADSPQRMVAINDAWEVLGDERLRYAYDRRDELLSVLMDADAVASEFEEDDDPVNDAAPNAWRCKSCGDAFPTFDAAVEHSDVAHPERIVVDPRAAVEAL